MINQFELRKGNYVSFEKTTHVLTEIRENDCISFWKKQSTTDYYTHPYNQIEGIDISEDSLKMLGFDFEGSEAGDDGNMEFGDIYGDDWYFLMLFQTGRYTEEEHLGLWVKHGNDSILIPIDRCKYIHQLQNIYSDFTGKQLI